MICPGMARHTACLLAARQRTRGNVPLVPFGASPCREPDGRLGSGAAGRQRSMASDTFDALLANHEDGSPPRVDTLSRGDLPDGDVLVEVAYSTVNYKDALAASPDGQVARISPLVPGIDLAGTVVEGPDPGAQALAHGYEIGVARHGGYARYARVPSEWLVPLPPGLSAREAMTLGTAGFTAALSVIELAGRGVAPGDGPVLVTGAT